MTETALVPMTLKETMDLGATLVKSGYYADVKQAAQAVVKILAGRELGLGPIASMAGVYIIRGKPTVGAGLMSAVINGSGVYSYRIIALDNDQCELAIFKHGNELQPHILFTMEDAVRAELTTGKNAHSWNHYPRNMLFARAISNTARWHCPELFGGGTVYTPEELGAQVDGETGDIIEGVATVVREPPKPQPQRSPTNGTRPYAPEDLKARLTSLIDQDDKNSATQAQRGLVAGKLEECFAGESDSKAKRYSVMHWLFGFESTKLTNPSHVDAILRWLLVSREKDDTGDYVLHPHAPAEAAAIVRQARIGAGQQELPIE